MIYLLSPTSYEGVTHLPMIAFRVLSDSIEFGDADMLLFTSKKAVEFADGIDPAWRTYDCVVVGEATAKAVRDLGGRVAYYPERFYGKAVSEAIARYFQERIVLYLRPKVTAFDTAALLRQAGVHVREQILYETICRKYPQAMRPPKDAVIVCTSPSTIRCFMDQYGWDESYRAVVIGETTRRHLPQSARVWVANKPTIASCVAKAREILRNSNAR